MEQQNSSGEGRGGAEQQHDGSGEGRGGGPSAGMEQRHDGSGEERGGAEQQHDGGGEGRGGGPSAGMEQQHDGSGEGRGGRAEQQHDGSGEGRGGGAEQQRDGSGEGPRGAVAPADESSSAEVDATEIQLRVLRLAELMTSILEPALRQLDVYWSKIRSKLGGAQEGLRAEVEWIRQCALGTAQAIKRLGAATLVYGLAGRLTGVWQAALDAAEVISHTAVWRCEAAFPAEHRGAYPVLMLAVARVVDRLLEVVVLTADILERVGLPPGEHEPSPWIARLRAKRLAALKRLGEAGVQVPAWLGSTEGAARPKH